ncbi:helix-turn-helix domain-containing protein [Listeria fleischmannii]|uniref:Helix-turn-helix family protein n=1 Tax=Listeria fleischmannii FSL S10-1203 TaxID=1265822 RepID=W7DFF9_9LIST|nr:helix-turn-helix transcriptional regulator [Listeria fleischmannii]EUJ46191.1 helix-turn-helix family protein [Listeria fleischmannii FSL S10-1203]
MNIHERISVLRKRRNISQKEFAKMVKLDDSTMSKIENGQRPIKHLEIERIADALDVSIDELFGRKQNTGTEILLLRFENGLSNTDKNRILSFIEKGSDV